MLDIAHSVQHGLVWLHARPRVRADDLAPKEAVVARLIVQGNTYKEIAQALHRAPATVRSQIRSSIKSWRLRTRRKSSMRCGWHPDVPTPLESLSHVAAKRADRVVRGRKDWWDQASTPDRRLA